MTLTSSLLTPTNKTELLFHANGPFGCGDEETWNAEQKQNNNRWRRDTNMHKKTQKCAIKLVHWADFHFALFSVRSITVFMPALRWLSSARMCACVSVYSTQNISHGVSYAWLESKWHTIYALASSNGLFFTVIQPSHQLEVPLPKCARLQDLSNGVANSGFLK